MKGTTNHVAACASNGYLSLVGSEPAMLESVENLKSGLLRNETRTIVVDPESSNVDTIKPVTRIRFEIASGPVMVRIDQEIAVLSGGARELGKLVDQMLNLIADGPGRSEILRVFDDAYDHIDASTHIDFVVT